MTKTPLQQLADDIAFLGLVYAGNTNSKNAALLRAADAVVQDVITGQMSSLSRDIANYKAAAAEWEAINAD